MDEDSEGVVISDSLADKSSFEEKFSRLELAKKLIKQLSHDELVNLHVELNNKLSIDVVTNLINLNCFHIVSKIFCMLDAKTLASIESVSRTWSETVSNSISWQYILKSMVKINPIWRGFSEARGWDQFLYAKLRTVSKGYYRHVYWLTIKDMKKLQQNWNFGFYRTKRISCNSDGDLNGVYCIQYDDKRLYSGHRDHVIRIWDMRTFLLVGTMTGHTGSILAMSYQGATLISGSSDSTIRVWCIPTRVCVKVVIHHHASILHIWFLNNIVASASKDKTIAMWRLSGHSLELQARLKGHKAAVNAVEFDSHFIVSASGDSTIKLWDATTYKCINTLQNHKRGIACLHYRYPILMSGSSDSDIRIWDVEKGVCIKTLIGHQELVRCIRFDDRYIISGSYDGHIMIWNTRIAMLPKAIPLVTTINKHSARVFRIQMDHFKFVTSSYDDTIIIWNFLDPNLDSPSLWTPRSSTSIHNELVFN